MGRTSWNVIVLEREGDNLLALALVIPVSAVACYNPRISRLLSTPEHDYVLREMRVLFHTLG